MATDLNNNLVNTRSNKIRKVTALKRFILEEIDSNQSIKRFMRYITKSPLSKKSEDYDFNIITQKDIESSLTKTGNDGEQCLFSGSFNPDMDNIKIPYIFVHSSRSKIDGINNNIYFVVYILCPERYNRLVNYGEERMYEIADEIVQTLDGYSLENNELSKEVGNLQFEIDGSFEEYRMSKANDVVVLAIPIRVKNIVIRGRIK